MTNNFNRHNDNRHFAGRFSSDLDLADMDFLDDAVEAVYADDELDLLLDDHDVLLEDFSAFDDYSDFDDDILRRQHGRRRHADEYELN